MARAPRLLLSTTYRPFCVDDPFDSAQNQVQHGSCHRQFTREQGLFTIHQQCSFLSLHLIAANLDAEVDVLEYPSLDELRADLVDAVHRGHPYDYVGVSATASTIRKARRMCEVVAEVSPGTRTVVGGGGAMAVGEVVEPFSDHLCKGDGVRFMRELLGQDADAPIRHPVVPSNHFPNRIAAWLANPASYSLAVSLGCRRRCPFCSTSAQFDGERIPVLGDAAQVVEAMAQTDAERPGNGSIHFVIFDENFLSDGELARAFLELNRENIAAGRLYLPFVFADAQSVSRYSVEELLEMGVDALWIGLETSDRDLSKNRDVDFAALVDELQSNGIKVFLSFIAGLEKQSLASIERDIEYALSLGAAAYQYAVACPFPGTLQWRRLREAGRLVHERPEQLNMSHYYLDHEELDEATVLERTDAFQRLDYERHGPLALRYLRMRLSGYRRHRDSPSPALRERARGFRNDAMDVAGLVSWGPVFAPTARVRRQFVHARDELRRSIRWGPVLRDLARGRIPAKAVVQHALFTNRIVEPLLRPVLVAWALSVDPRTRDRCRTPWGLIRTGRRCVAEASHGNMPWDQPVLVRTHYSSGSRRR